jgi:ribosome-associated protein
MNDDAPSKSARKREAHRLQELGRELAELGAEQRARIPMGDDLARALVEYHRIRSHEAKRRHLQYIGRLMRDEDADGIGEAIETAKGTGSKARYELQHCERWRDRIIAEDDALTQYVDEHPGTDIQTLRGLVRRSRSHPEDADASRALFRFIRDSRRP